MPAARADAIPPRPARAPDARSIGVARRQRSTAHPDRHIKELADAQYGVVARRQLLELGVTAAAIRSRLERGWLVLLHPGVYAVGHRALRREGRALAAVLAAGPGAVLSHRDAAGLYGIRPANHRRTDVTVDAKRVAPAGVRLHRAGLPADETTVLDGIPVTTLPRTLVDLAGIVPRDHLARALSEAERVHRVDAVEIERILARTRTRNGRGHAVMSAALADLRSHGVARTRSDLEQAFLALVARARLPRPRANAVVHGVEVDAYWPQRQLAVELDGWTWHRTRRAFQRDREKANALAARGVVVLRFTERDVTRRPADVVDTLTRVLAARRR